MKSLFLVACVLMMSACGKSGDGSAVASGSSAECPNVEGTYVDSAGGEGIFSKTADGTPKLRSADGVDLEVNGPPYQDGTALISLTCSKGAFVVNVVEEGKRTRSTQITIAGPNRLAITFGDSVEYITKK